MRRSQLGIVFFIAVLSGCGGGGGESANPPTAPSSPANGAPISASATIATAEDTTSAATTPSVTDPDSNDTHTFAVVSQPSNGSATVVGNQLLYTPAANFNGSDSFTFRATDSGGLSVDGTAAVNVTAVNDAPAISGTSDSSVIAANAYSFTPSASDVDGDLLTFSIANKPSWANFNTATGALTGTPTYFDGPATNIRISVSDGNVVTDLAAFNINVTGSCVSDSVSPVGTSTIIKSAPCGRYAEMVTRKTSGEADVVVKYMVHTPAGTPKAVAILFAGGTGNAGIVGSGSTVTSAGNNFLVRSAQLFAERGYLTVTVDRPSDVVTTNPRTYDDYRISSRHGVDIARIAAAENGANLNVFLVGTSRGAFSAVGNHELGMAIAISSAVTSAGATPVASGGPRYLGDGSNRLQPEFVTVPTHMKIHSSDLCSLSAPANAPSIFARFTSVAALYATAGVENHYAAFNGGFDLTGTGSPVIDACDAKTYHGFLGIENAAVADTTAWMDDALAKLTASNGRPVAGPTTVAAANTGTTVVELGPLATDGDGDSLTFSLLYPYSARSSGTNNLSLSGSTVTYTPLASGVTDHFVYVVSDGKGGRSFNVVTVNVAP